MPTALLTAVFVSLTAAVIIALFAVMWRERRSQRDAVVAIAAALVLTAWAVLAGTLAARGAFLQPDASSAPPVGIALGLELLGLAIALLASPTLRRLLGNQTNLLRLNVWRLVGVVFLILMTTGQMPAVWAIPAGGGDILIGLAAFPVAAGLERPGGRRRAIIFNWLGLLDLVVAIGLGVTTGPGPVGLFHTTPTSELAVHFPLALVPTFLVPLAVMLHVLSLWQLSRRPQAAAASVGAVR